MDKLFRGYIVCHGKKCTQNFAKVPDNKLMKLEEATQYASYAGVLDKDIEMIDIDDMKMAEVVFGLIQKFKIPTIVYQTGRGMHFYFKGTRLNTARIKTYCAIGIPVDIKLGNRNGYAVLRLDGVDRELIYNKGLSEVPAWLTPLNGVTDIKFWGMVDGDGRDDVLYNHIITLTRAGLTREESRQTLRIINDYIFAEPMGKKEVDTILRDEAFEGIKDKIDFYDEKGKPNYEVISAWLINNKHFILMDDILHVYNKSKGIYSFSKTAVERVLIEEFPGCTQRFRKEVLEYIKLSAPVKELNHRFISFKNGTLDIKAAALYNHSPEYVVVNHIPHPYQEPSAESIAKLEKFMLDFADGRSERVTTLYEVGGLCIYPKSDYRKAFILLGEKLNGKSTFLDLLNKSLGKANTSALDLKELNERFKASMLKGKLANIGDDISGDYISDTSIFKKLTAGNAISAEFKGRDPFEFENYATMIFSANTLPRVSDNTQAVTSRINIIPFTHEFKVNPAIKDELLTDTMCEAYLWKSMEALKHIFKFGITETDEQRELLNNYDKLNNPVLEWLELNNPTDMLCSDAYRQYSVWCNQNGCNPINNKKFGGIVKNKLNLVAKVVKENGKSKKKYVKYDEDNQDNQDK